MQHTDVGDASPKSIVFTVFIALVLDLLAFTIPLPLFPRLIAWYLHRESHSPDTLLSRSLHLTHSWRARLLFISDQSTGNGSRHEKRWLRSVGGEGDGNRNWDVVLLGGAMGSLFSLCQCVISPWLGRLSDRYGRKRVLLLTMVGNILSAVIWLQSTSFSSFLLSRLVGGLSEGNVQLSTAIISDVTTPSTRSRSLALVGIAFSVCFTLGHVPNRFCVRCHSLIWDSPSLGAYFASRPMPLSSTSTKEDTLNIYAAPAAISLVLLLAETSFLAVRLPETKGWQQDGETTINDTKSVGPPPGSVDERLTRLNAIGRLHGLFLLFFSGAEFTLTFLTFDLFSATNAQNGRLLSFIGVLAALLQARHVRPSLSRLGELRLCSRGMLSCVIGLSLLAALPLNIIRSSTGLATMVLYAAASALAYTSATVVTGLTAAAAGCCDENVKTLKRGRALGGFRSRGQLGRAIGPILASSIYWIQGPSACYATIAACMAGVWLIGRSQADDERKRREETSKGKE